MDTKIVRVIERDYKTPDLREAATRPGTRIGKLTVVKRNALGNVILKCDCGETIRLSPKIVATGKNYQCRSCDKWCHKSPARQILGDKLYRSAKSRGKSAKDRCENSNSKYYNRYGGRGVMFSFGTIEDYVNAIAPFMVNGAKEREVDRVDNDGHYEQGNMRLVSKKENIRNRAITFMPNGLPFAQIAENHGLFDHNKRLYRRAYSRVRDALHLGIIVDEDFIVNTVKDVVDNPARLRPDHQGYKCEAVMAGSERLLDVMSKAGYSGNKRVYDAVKRTIYNRRNTGKPDYTVAEAIEHAHRYAANHGIKPQSIARGAA